jgi:hypothetical protein
LPGRLKVNFEIKEQAWQCRFEVGTQQKNNVDRGRTGAGLKYRAGGAYVCDGRIQGVNGVDASRSHRHRVFIFDVGAARARRVQML